VSRQTSITGQGPGRPAATIGLDDSGPIGSAMAIHLSQPASVTTAAGPQIANPQTWTVEVYVVVSEGEYLVGTLVTIAPAAGARAARTIGIAFIPGAKNWRVVVSSDTVGATCSVVLSTDDCCYGAALGLVVVSGAALASSEWTAPNVPKAVQGVLSGGPTTLTKAYGYLEVASPASSFFGFVDKAAAIVNGDLFLVAPVPVPDLWPRAFSFSFDPRGLRFAAQARWCVSATDDAVTLSVGVAKVEGERLV